MNDEIQAKALRAARWIADSPKVKSVKVVRHGWDIEYRDGSVSQLADEDMDTIAEKEGWKDEEV